jgi:hypothetical protein
MKLKRGPIVVTTDLFKKRLGAPRMLWAGMPNSFVRNASLTCRFLGLHHNHISASATLLISQQGHPCMDIQIVIFLQLNTVLIGQFTHLGGSVEFGVYCASSGLHLADKTAGKLCTNCVSSASSMPAARNAFTIALALSTSVPNVRGRCLIVTCAHCALTALKQGVNHAWLLATHLRRQLKLLNWK